jgi:CubicO group peptidase (beta-lactamase class C family)
MGLLGLALERIAQQPLANLIDGLIARPLGLRHAVLAARG